MITVEFITALFYHVDEPMRAMPKHPDAHLWPSEVVTLGLLHGLNIAKLSRTAKGQHFAVKAYFRQSWG